jgi:hypothetical protein
MADVYPGRRGRALALGFPISGLQPVETLVSISTDFNFLFQGLKFGSPVTSSQFLSFARAAAKQSAYDIL